MKSVFSYIGRALCIGVCAACLQFSASVQAIELKAQTTMTFKGGIFSSKPTEKEKIQAIQTAKQDVIKSYLAMLGQAQQRQLAGVQDQILADPDQYLTSFRIVSEEINKEPRFITIVSRGEVNEELIKSLLPRGNAATGLTSGEGSLFSALFVARRVTELKTFDERRTEIAKSEDSADNSISATSESRGRTSVRQSGGNTVRKAAQASYGLIASTDFDAAFNDVLTTVGYETVDYSDVSSECSGPAMKQIQEAFRDSDELPQAVRKKVIAAAKRCEVRYLAVGYMNVSVPFKDSVTGNEKVLVAVNGMVWDLSKRLPRKVGSAGPVQAFGLGPDEAAARREALRIAARQSAEIVASQLGVKQIR